MKRERKAEVLSVERVHATPMIRRALESGGTCAVAVGSKRRMLVHDPTLDAPERPLPWPFSLLQPHTIRYVVYEDERRVSSHIFVRNRVDEAIDYFLRDVPSDSKVTITLK